MSRDKCKLRKMLAMAQYLPTLWPVSPSLSWYSADLEGAAQLVPSLDHLVLADLSERISTGHNEVKTKKALPKAVLGKQTEGL